MLAGGGVALAGGGVEPAGGADDPAGGPDIAGPVGATAAAAGSASGFFSIFACFFKSSTYACSFLRMTASVICGFTWLWMLVRCILGAVALARDEPVLRPYSWLL